MTKRVIRVGGVHEPFNLPWIRAFDQASFADLGIEVTFESFAGGTGALVAALESGTIDLATVLTEGAVTAIANGSDVQLHSAFTTSPLTWGIHVAAKSTATKVADLEGKKFAISRHGSGSELMAYVLAAKRRWELKDKQFVVVGGVDGAVEALPKRKAHIFLWERFVTAPLVKQGVFRRVGDLPTPWPAFYTAARPGLLDDDRGLVDRIVDVVLGHATEIAADVDATIDEIVDRYDMTRRDARTWLQRVDWPTERLIDDEVLESVMATMHDLGRIAEPVPVRRLG